MNEARLSVIGGGTMGEAIVAGLLRAQAFAPDDLRVTTRRAVAAHEFHERVGVRTTTDNVEACAFADAVLICLKPQRIPDVLSDPAVTAAIGKKLVISVAAGTTCAQLQTWLPEAAVIRAMPNTPALIGAGMTVLARGEGVGDDQLALAERVFACVGRTLELEEKQMNAVTSLNGSGPAFAYVMLEAFADGGVMMGLPRDVALTIAAQVFGGSAKMVLDTDLHPAALKDQVTTPAGCTIAGLLTMEDGRIRSVIARAVQEAAKVAGQLG